MEQIKTPDQIYSELFPNIKLGALGRMACYIATTYAAQFNAHPVTRQTLLPLQRGLIAQKAEAMKNFKNFNAETPSSYYYSGVVDTCIIALALLPEEQPADRHANGTLDKIEESAALIPSIEEGHERWAKEHGEAYTNSDFGKSVAAAVKSYNQWINFIEPPTTEIK